MSCGDLMIKLSELGAARVESALRGELKAALDSWKVGA